jgi:hypothetical protein
MGTADGFIQGMTKIVDNGPAASRYNVVLLAEGYTAGQMGQWASDAQEFVDGFFAEAPFSDLDLRCGINVYRVDVVSDESGADDPDCDGDGPGTTAATYFDASFCGDGVIRRLLVSNSSIAVDVLDAQVPEWHTGLVIVNSPVRGGAGGQVPTTSTGGDWVEVAIHELGHSAFGLADEYEYWQGCASDETDRDNHPGPEPTQPNVTRVSNAATIKWAADLTPSVAMPTTSNADCSACDTQANPVAAATVGAFEGAHYYHCGAFRPQFDCKMRATGWPFCAVCLRVIRTTIAPFAQPTTVTLVSPSLNFTDVEEGLATARGVTFAVDSCAPMTFRVTDGPRRTDGGPELTPTNEPVLDLPLGGVTVSTPPPRGRTAYVWVVYRAVAAGDLLGGTITVECDETGQSWTIPITGSTIPRVSVGAVLSLDTSGSMLGAAAGGGTKADALRDAAEVFVDVIPDEDGAGVNTFDTDAYPGVPIAVAGSGVFGAGRIAARNEVRDYVPNPAGMTAIGDAVELSDSMLQAATGFDQRAMVIFTDGKETEPKYISEVTGLIASNPRIFAIGLGTAQNLEPATLAALCSGNEGYMLMTGSGGDTFFRLAKYYLQILAGLTNAEIVLDPEGVLTPATGEVRIPFLLAETDTGADAVLVTPAPGLVRYTLETPDGDVIAPGIPAPGATFTLGARNSYYRVALPTLVNGRQAREGTWHVVLELDRKGYNDDKYRSVTRVSPVSGPGIPYTVIVQARSNLKLLAQCHQDSYEPGAQLRIRARLTEYGLPVEERATVRAEVVRPDGSAASLPMPEIEPGVFETVEVAHQLGITHIRVLASGTTLRGRAFTREHLLTGITYRGGDDPPARSDPGGSSGSDWCALLACLSRALTPQLRERLTKAGFDVEVALRCLRGVCGGSRPGAKLSDRDLQLIGELAKQAGLIVDHPVLRDDR